jgi:hypothetical protein
MLGKLFRPKRAERATHGCSELHAGRGGTFVNAFTGLDANHDVEGIVPKDQRDLSETT